MTTSTRVCLSSQQCFLIAEAFHISSNTVQDHLKAIFEKVGVRSRRELVGQLFAQHYQPRIATGCGLESPGWFT